MRTLQVQKFEACPLQDSWAKWGFSTYHVEGPSQHNLSAPQSHYLPLLSSFTCRISSPSHSFPQGPTGLVGQLFAFPYNSIV